MKKLGGMGKLFVGIAAGFALVVGSANAAVCATTAPDIVDAPKARELHADCILALGAAVRADGSLSHMLQDRLDVAASLYFEGVAPKIIVSGNGGESSHNEPAAMKAYLVGLGVSSEDVYCDGYGFNTYDSMWRGHAFRKLHSGRASGARRGNVSSAEVRQIDGAAPAVDVIHSRQVRQISARAGRSGLSEACPAGYCQGADQLSSLKREASLFPYNLFIRRKSRSL